MTPSASSACRRFSGLLRNMVLVVTLVALSAALELGWWWLFSHLDRFVPNIEVPAFVAMGTLVLLVPIFMGGVLAIPVIVLFAVEAGIALLHSIRERT